MRVDLQQITEFFKNLYGDPAWPGVLYIEVMELLVDAQGKRKARLKARRVIKSLADIEGMEEVILNTMQSVGHHFFYTTAFTDSTEKRTKENVIAVPALWADVDDVNEEEMKERLKHVPIPASGVVATGGGYHIYWLLDEYREFDPSVEEALRRVRDWVGAPKGTTDVTRLLRVPGTWNNKPWKYNEPRECKIVYWMSTARYKLEEFLKSRLTFAEIKLPEEFKDKYVLRGEFIGDKQDRSTRDFAIIKELLVAGHTEDEIRDIFTNPDFGCASKGIERGAEYINATIKNARTEVGERFQSAIYDDGKKVLRKKVTQNGVTSIDEISNFVVVPKRYIEFVHDEHEAAEVEVVANGRRKSFICTSEDLFTHRRFIPRCDFVGLAWMANDVDWNHYVRYLFDRTLPTEKASDIVGWCGPAFVLPKETWFADDITYVKTLKGYPTFARNPDDASFDPEKLMREIIHYARKLHQPHCSLPTLGWVLASAFAPQVRERYAKQFPHLMLEGQPGRGKTTLIRAFMSGLFGIDTEYSQQTSLAAIRRAVAGSNALPIFVDEYEDNNSYFSVGFNSILRSAYVAGQAQRVGSEQIEEFKLLAPVVVTSITGFTDAALQERTYSVRIPKFDKDAGREALAWFRDIPQGQFLKWWLQQEPTWIPLIKGFLDVVDDVDRQQMCFATTAAVLMWCSGRWGWGLELSELKKFWEINKQKVVKIDPYEALDILLAHTLKVPGILIKDDAWRIDGEQLVMKQAETINQMLLHHRDLSLGVTVTRQWVIKTFTDGLDGDYVNYWNTNKSVGGVVGKRFSLNLEKWPHTLEAVKSLI